MPVPCARYRGDTVPPYIYARIVFGRFPGIVWGAGRRHAHKSNRKTTKNRPSRARPSPGVRRRRQPMRREHCDGSRRNNRVRDPSSACPFVPRSDTAASTLRFRSSLIQWVRVRSGRRTRYLHAFSVQFREYCFPFYITFREKFL